MLVQSSGPRASCGCANAPIPHEVRRARRTSTAVAFLRSDGTAPLPGQPPLLQLLIPIAPTTQHDGRSARLMHARVCARPSSLTAMPRACPRLPRPPFRSRGTAAEGGPRHMMALPRGHAVRLVVCAGLAALLAPARAKLYNYAPNGMDTRGSSNPKDWDARAVTTLAGVFHGADFNADIG